MSDRLNQAAEELKVGGDRELAALLIQLDIAQSLRYIVDGLGIVAQTISRRG